MDEQYVRFNSLAGEVGYEAAYAQVYGELDEHPAEFARRLHQYLGLGDVVALVRLRYGTGSQSQVHRWLNDATRKRHNEYRRKQRAKARKYARNLATRGFPLDEIQRRITGKYGKEYTQSVKGWIKSRE